MSQKSDLPNPVQEDYETLFREVGKSVDAWPRQMAVAKIEVKMGWELTEAIKEFRAFLL